MAERGPGGASTRIFGIDVYYYLKNGGYLFLDYAATSAFGLLTVYCFSRFATPELYGSYTYIQSILATLMFLSLPGVTTAVLRSASRGYDGALARGIWMRFRFSLIGTLTLGAVALYFYFTEQRDFAIGCVIGSAVFPFLYSFTDFRAYLQGREEYRTFLLYGVPETTIGSIATIAAVLYASPFLVILLVNLVARSLGSAVFVALTIRKLRNRDVDDEFRPFVRNMNLLAVLGTIVYYVDKVIVGYYLGMVELAVFKVASVLTEPLRTLGVFVNRLIFPRLARSASAGTYTRFRRHLPLVFGLVLALAAASWLILPVIVRLFFATYLDSIPLIYWMVGSACSAVVLIYLETFYVSQDRLHRFFYANNVARQVVMIALMFVLIRWFGAVGVVWAKLFVRVGSVVYFTGRIWRNKDRPTGEIRPPGIGMEGPDVLPPGD